MKISKTHHVTKNRVVKRNPPKKEKIYTLVVDYGKPFEEKHNYCSLMRRLKELQRIADSDRGEYAYFDVFIYDGEKDVTNKMFDDFSKNVFAEESGFHGG